MANVAAVQEALKYTYGVNKVLYLFNEESVTWALHATNKKRMGGRGQHIMPLWVKNPGAFTGIVEGGALPAALQPDTTEATFDLQEYVATYDVTWKLIQDASTDKFAFERAIKMLDDGLKRRIFRNLNSDLIGDGRGALGVLPAADNQVTISLNTPFRGEVGMVVDVMDLSDDDTKLADSVTVTAVDPITNEVTVSGAPAGTAAGDYIVIQDTTDVSISGSLHTFGLMAVISDANPAAVVGNFGNVNRSTAGNEFWKSVVLANGGVNRALTEDLLIQAQDGVRLKGGGQLDRWLTNLPITRRYHEMLRAESFAALSSIGPIGGGLGRKAVKPGDNGKTPYEFGGIPWYVDPYFYANTVIGQDSSAFYLGVGENEVPRPISDIFDNIPFFRQTTSATFEVAWYYQMQLLSDNPAAGVKVSDVAES